MENTEDEAPKDTVERQIAEAEREEGRPLHEWERRLIRDATELKRKIRSRTARAFRRGRPETFH